ncbi:putative leucine-rich repeat-containing protein DDB_G0290503 isoform X2 [Onthophagus taurus]
MGVSTNKTRLGVCKVYKWFGRHFDLVDELQSVGASSIGAFTIGSNEFIVVGNQMNEFQQKEMFSYVYKYDLESESYEINQKLATYGVKKIRFVNFMKENFLVVVNSQKDDVKNFHTVVIYKFIDDYFMPYEGFELEEPNDVFLISEPNRNNLLGIFSQNKKTLVIYSYDGWIFKKIKSKNLEATSLKVTKFSNQTVLITQEQTQLIIYNLTFTKETTFKNVEDDLLNWCQTQINVKAPIKKKIQEVTSGSTPTETDAARTSNKMKNYRFNNNEDIFDSLELELSKELEKLNDISKTIEINQNELIIKTDLIVDELIINGAINMNELKSNEINNELIEPILNDLIDLNVLSNLEKFQFENVLIEDSPNFLNGNNKNDLLDYNKLEGLKNIEIKNVSVENINVININDINLLNLLINAENQTFNKHLEINNLKGNNINILSDINNNKCSFKVNQLNQLNVEDLKLDYLNDIDAKKLIKNENLTKLFVDTLISKTINIKNNSSIDNLVNIANNEFKFVSLNFNDVEMNDLEIIENLNEINVIDGKLDVNIKQDFSLNNETIVFIDGSYEIKDDFDLNGNLNVRSVDVKNIKTKRSIFGLGDLEKAFKLNEIVINETVYFNNIEIENINTSFINNISTNDLKNNQNCSISGLKIINSDLIINENSKIKKINGFHLEEFDKTVLTVNGDQILNGDYFVHKLTSDSIQSQNILIGNTPWSTISESTTKINVTIHLDSLELKKSFIENLTTTNLNDINLKNLFDSLLNDSNLSGDITFNSVYAKNVTSKNHFDTQIIPGLINKIRSNYKIETDLDLDEINVENVNVKGFINDINADSFKKLWLQDADEHLFENEETLNNVTILGKGEIKGRLNDFDLEELFESIVKIDENHQFDDVTFEDRLIALNLINLQGNIVGLDLDSAITVRETQQEISGLKIFESPLIINGSLNFDGEINGVKLENICEILSKEKVYNLIINGNANFTKGPNIETINNKSLIHLLNNVWFKNRPTQLNGYFKFVNVSFQSDVKIKGNFNEINLKNLINNYFSITKNQTISSHLDFTKGLNFFKNLTAEEILLAGSISGVRLKDIIGKALLDGYTQVFDETFYGDKIVVDELNGEFLLNDLDLQKQIMRYDLETFVEGRKEFLNLTVQNLVVSKDSLIQNVNFTKWVEEAVMKDGGKLEQCIFEDDVSFKKQLSVIGNVNGKKFNNQTVLINNLNQTILGKIVLESNATFTELELKHLNGVDFELFLKEIVQLNENTKINSKIAFNSLLSTDNLEIKKLYNQVNIGDLLTNITSFNFDNFDTDYNQLVNISRQLQYSLDSTQKYLHHYELIRGFNNVIHFELFNNLLILTDTNHIYLYGWDSLKNTFVLIKDFEHNVIFIGKILIGDQSYLYSQYHQFADISKLTEENEFEIVEKLIITNTNSIYNLKIAEKNIYCSLFSSHYNSELYCKEKDQFQQKQTFKSIEKASSLIMNGETFLITSNSQRTDNFVTILQYNKDFSRFVTIQRIYIVSPCSITSISYKQAHYLAIASSHIEDAIYSGSVHIKWFHPNIEMFVSYQSIDINSPIQVEFAILPSKELVLYVLTRSGSLLIYEHEGEFGFNLKHSVNTNAKSFKLGEMHGEHLVLASGLNQMKVVRGIFKNNFYG